MRVLTTVPLTPKQLGALRYVAGYIHSHQFAPTIEEIGTHMGVSKVTAFEHVNSLVKKGLLVKAAGKQSRSLSIAPGVIGDDVGFPSDALMARVRANACKIVAADGEAMAAEGPVQPTRTCMANADIDETIRIVWDLYQEAKKAGRAT